MRVAPHTHAHFSHCSTPGTRGEYDLALLGEVDNFGP